MRLEVDAAVGDHISVEVEGMCISADDYGVWINCILLDNPNYTRVMPWSKIVAIDILNGVDK